MSPPHAFARSLGPLPQILSTHPPYSHRIILPLLPQLVCGSDANYVAQRETCHETDEVEQQCN